jgi:hypothetical protein
MKHKISIAGMLGVLIAITGAYYSTQASALLASAYYQSSMNCVAGTLDPGTCSTILSETRCTINIAGHPNAWAIKSGVTCIDALYRQP